MIWGSAAARDYCIPFYIILDAYYPVLNKTPIQYCNLNGLRMYYYSSKQESQTCFHVLYRKSASLMRLQWPRKDQGIGPVSEFGNNDFTEIFFLQNQVAQFLYFKGRCQYVINLKICHSLRSFGTERLFSLIYVQFHIIL